MNLKRNWGRILKKGLLFITPILVFSLIVFSPSFHLDFDGDSYLTLWRYLTQGPKNGLWSHINYFLTDYGPQDTIFTAIYKIFGLKSVYFYVISYIVRICAALSFYPLVVKLTKNRFAGYLSTLFFSVTAIGAETTNWVFNMPSYVGIFLLNLFLLNFISLKERPTVFKGIISGILYIATIILQPIRMVFLPLLLVGLNIFWFFQEKSRPLKVKNIFGLFVPFIILTVIVFLIGNIGNSIGINKRLADSSGKQIAGRLQNYFSEIKEPLQTKRWQIFLYPVAQVGAMLLPSNIYAPNPPPAQETRFLIKFVLAVTIIFYLLLDQIKRVFSMSKSAFLVIFGVMSAWNGLILLQFRLLPKYPLPYSAILEFMAGGFAIAVAVLALIKSSHKQNNSLGIILTLLLTGLPLIIPWIRNPLLINEITGRYLIVPAAGVAIFLGVICSVFTKKRPAYLPLALIAVFIFAQSYTTYAYFSKLASVRDITNTEIIRSSLPHIKPDGPKEPIIVYFETDKPDVLYHSLQFGFPVILALKQNFPFPWNIAYTDNWQEVESGYLTGEGLKRFATVPIKPVKINNIYSIYIRKGSVTETSRDIRQKLLNIKHDKTG